MKKWLVRSSTGNASAQLVETSAGIRVRIPGKGSVFAEMTDICVAELRCLPGVSVVAVEELHAVKELEAVRSDPEPAEAQPEQEPPRKKRKKAPRKKGK